MAAVPPEIKTAVACNVLEGKAMIAAGFLRAMARRMRSRREELAVEGVEPQALAAALREAVSAAEAEALESCGLDAAAGKALMRSTRSTREVRTASRALSEVCDPSSEDWQRSSSKSGDDGSEKRKLISFFNSVVRIIEAEREDIVAAAGTVERLEAVITPIVDGAQQAVLASMQWPAAEMNAAQARLSSDPEVLAAARGVMELLVDIRRTLEVATAGGGGGAPASPAAGGGGGGPEDAAAARGVRSFTSSVARQVLAVGASVSAAGLSGSAAIAVVHSTQSEQGQSMQVACAVELFGSMDSFGRIATTAASGPAGREAMERFERVIRNVWALASYMAAHGTDAEGAMARMSITPEEAGLC